MARRIMPAVLAVAFGAALARPPVEARGTAGIIGYLGGRGPSQAAHDTFGPSAARVSRPLLAPDEGLRPGQLTTENEG